MPIPLLAVAAPMAIGQLMAIAAQMFSNPLNIVAQRLFPILPPDVQRLVTLRYRDEITEEQYLAWMKDNGFGEEQAGLIFQASRFFPSPSDLVSWQAREVFEPIQIERFGLDDGFEQLQLDTFFKAGVDETQALNFWRAHWEHPPFNQVSEMRHRDILAELSGRDQADAGTEAWEAVRGLSDELLFEWYGLVEIPPFWRERLTKLSDALITRVDLRRMWDMRVITETRLLRGYLDLGYNLGDAQDLVLWTKVNEDFPVLVARYRNLHITSAQLLEELENLGLPPERALDFYQTRIQNLEAPMRVAKEKDLTKSEIIKGVKKDIITRAEGRELLEDLGYDPNEAEFVMNINIEAEGSPEDFADLKELTQQFRKGAGLPASEISARARMLQGQLRTKEQELRDAQQRNAPDRETDLLTAERTTLAKQLRDEVQLAPQTEPAQQRS